MSGILMDFQTILFLSYGTNAILASLLAVAGRDFRGAWLWVAAQGLLALGTLGDALPPQVFPWIPLILGNSAYVASSLLYSHSVWVFRYTTRFSPWLYLIIPLQIVSFIGAFFQPYLVRALVFSLWMTLGPLITAGLLMWKVERRFWLSNTLTALPFLILGLASLGRVILLSILSYQGEVFEASPMNVWYVGGAILLSTITLFGYFMMTGIKAVQIALQKDKEIETRNRKLIEAGRDKDLFFAIVAHDLRGPISGAARYARKHLFGKMTGLEAKYAEVETLTSSLEKTHEFLEKLLWWSRTQLEDWLPLKNKIHLSLCLSQALAQVHSLAELKRISINQDIPENLTVWGDPESVQLILSNLLSNAIKYSWPDQSIYISAREEGGQCRIILEDHGIGMDQQTLDRLFLIQDKLSSMGTSGERGSGMGLILSKSLAERNDGKISLESQPGKGTRASLWLSLK